MADDIGRSGEDPREVAARRRAEGEARRAAQRGQGMIARAAERAAASGGSGGRGGRALVLAGPSEPAPRGGMSLSPRGANAVTDAADRRIPLNLGSGLGTAGRVASRALPVVGTAQNVLSSRAANDYTQDDVAREGRAERARQVDALQRALPAGPDADAERSNRSDPPAPAPRPRPAAPRPAAPRQREMSADDLNAMVLDRLGKDYEGARAPDGPDASIARMRIDREMGMKKGGHVKAAPVRMAKGGAVKAKPVKMASGGKVRGDGVCRVRTRGRMV